MEEMRELSNRTIKEMADKNAEAYDIMFRKAARAAFKEGAMWFASELAKGMAAIGEEEKI